MQEIIITTLIGWVIALVAWIFIDHKKSSKESIEDAQESIEKAQGDSEKFITKEIHILKEETLWLRVKELFSEVRRDFAKLESQAIAQEQLWKSTKRSIDRTYEQNKLIMQKLGISFHDAQKN